jgi:hypothetical protein
VGNRCADRHIDNQRRIALTDNRLQDAEALTRGADAALYRAKVTGGNRYTVAPDRPRSVIAWADRGEAPQLSG